MSRFLLSVFVGAGLAASVAGCGGGKASAPTLGPTTTAAHTSSDPSAGLDLAVRRALQENYQLSGYVLWHNVVPRTALRSTRGPALAGLRSAAAQRRKRGIRIRPVTGRLRIISVVLEPSFSRATATTLASGRVRPYEAGHEQGHDIAVHERARVQLRRVGTSQQFVVWQVSLLR
jgi:hypothetical protein